VRGQRAVTRARRTWITGTPGSPVVLDRPVSIVAVLVSTEIAAVERPRSPVDPLVIAHETALHSADLAAVVIVNRMLRLTGGVHAIEHIFECESAARERTENLVQGAAPRTATTYC
jgi:hypothetical protein